MALRLKFGREALRCSAKFANSKIPRSWKQFSMPSKRRPVLKNCDTFGRIEDRYKLKANSMNHEAMQELLRREPFERFEIRLTNGEKYEIRHPKWPFC